MEDVTRIEFLLDGIDAIVVALRQRQEMNCVTPDRTNRFGERVAL